MKILLVQSGFLGDTVLSTPVIAGLKTRHSAARISVMTTPRASMLIEGDPLIKEVIVFDKRGGDRGVSGILKKAGELKKKGFDKAYALHRSYRTAIVLSLAGIPETVGFRDASLSFLYTRTVKKPDASHAVLRYLSLLSEETDRSAIETDLRLFEPAYEKVSRQVQHGLPFSGRYAVLAPGSVWKTKMWHWQGFAEVARFFNAKGIAVVLVGAKEESGVCRKIGAMVDVIDFSGRISLTDTMYVMKHALLAVTNDSMPLHMASAFKKPTVAVYCATSPAFGFGPWKNPYSAVVQDETLDCRPCRRHGSRKCPNGSEKCMQVSSEKVIEACRRVVPGCF